VAEGQQAGRKARWDTAIVRGRSMEPGLREGDRIFIWYGGRVRPGRVVVARFPDGTVTVKRATERRTTRTGAAAWWLLSDNAAEGIDSRHRGPIAEGAVLAVVVRRYWPLLRWPLSRRPQS